MKIALTPALEISIPPNWDTLQIFAITFEGKVIGEIGLNQRDEDRQNERAELVYSLSRQHWGKGLMMEAARAVMNWAFQTYSFNWMFAYSDPRNVRVDNPRQYAMDTSFLSGTGQDLGSKASEIASL